MIGALKDYYPDPLNYILVFEMPWVLNAAFKVIKTLLPPAAVKKIKFVNKSNMDEFVNGDNQLEEWGGTNPWQYKFEEEITQNGSRDSGFEDVREDICKKTVTFASPSPNLVLTPIISQMSGVTNMAVSSQADLLRISPGQEVTFSNTATGDLFGKIHIQNISTKVVGYKIKTTSPEKYRVRPSTGSLGLGQSAVVEMHVSGGYAMTPSSLVRDKFLITAVILESSDLGQQQLAEALKTSRPDGQYRLTCQLSGNVGGQVRHDGVGGMGLNSHGALSGQADTGRQLVSILKKVNQVVIQQEELSTQLRRCLHINLVLVGLLFLLLISLSYFRKCTSYC